MSPEAAQSPDWCFESPFVLRELRRLKNLIEIANAAFQHWYYLAENVFLERLGSHMGLVAFSAAILLVKQKLARIFTRSVHGIERATGLGARNRNHLLQDRRNLVVLSFFRV